jgi:hypothetical protein
MGRTENLIDPPISEGDAEALYTFFEQFLRKDPYDALSFLKSVTLVRRTDLREFVHHFALMRKRLETMLRDTRQRDLLLSYPSTIQRVHQLLWDGQEAYGDTDGSTIMSILGGQAVDYLDQTESFRVDLDSLLADCPAILPDDAVALRDAVSSGAGTFLFALVALADHVFLSLLPHDHPQPTEAVLRTRTFVQSRFGPKFEEQIVEFFVIGGGSLRVIGKRVVVSGTHPIFDPNLGDFGSPASERLLSDFTRGKYRLTLDALRAELPDQQYIVQG